MFDGEVSDEEIAFSQPLALHLPDLCIYAVRCLSGRSGKGPDCVKTPAEGIPSA